MHIKPGAILTSSPSLKDPHFTETIILLTEYNKNGATGFIVNKTFPRRLNELEEFKYSNPVTLYDGGPVDKEHLFFIHQRPDVIEGGGRIADTIYMGGNFRQAITHVNNRTLSEKDIKIFVGYCGWEHAQLEEEIAEGSWHIINANTEIIFATGKI